MRQWVKQSVSWWEMQSEPQLVQLLERQSGQLSATESVTESVTEWEMPSVMPLATPSVIE